MRKVSNRKVIRRLSYRTMKEKGMKNWIAVLAIMLTSLFTVSMSMLDTIQEATMRQVGTTAHGGFKYMTQSEFEAVKNIEGIKDISYNIVVGMGDNPELYGIQTEVRYSEPKAARWSFCEPDAGTLPKERLECATSGKVLDALGIPHRIGEEIPLKVRIGDKVVEEAFILSGYWETEAVLFAEEFFVSKEWQQEHRPVQTRSYNENRLAGEEGAEGYIDVSLLLPSSFDIEGQLQAITEKSGLPKEGVYTAVNWAYRNAEVDIRGILLVLLVIIIIMLSGYLIIYNIFFINVTADIRYYGLLKTVGTTGKQLKTMIRGQAFFLSAAGIPLGLAAGWLVGRGILPVMYKTLDTDGVRNIVINPWIFAGSALFSLLVVYISCIKPCRLAAGISPVEALRYAERTRFKKKEKKTGKINLFYLAAANVGRNRKKMAVVILSLTLCMVLLNATYTMVHGFDFDKYTKIYLTGDYLVKPLKYMDFVKAEEYMNLVTDTMLADIRKLPGIENACTMYESSNLTHLSEESVERFSRYIEENREEIGDERFWGMEADEVKERGIQPGLLYGIPGELMSYLTVREGTIDKEKLETGKYALLVESDMEEHSHWVGVGDKVRLYEDGEEVEIMAKVSIPWGMTAQYGIGYFSTDLVVDAQAYKKALAGRDGREPEGGMHVIITAKEGEEERLGKELSDYVENRAEGFTVISKESLRGEFSSYTRMYAAVGGVLCLILGMIGILNFMNSVVTGILARKQEFAMMESVGMTGAQLRNMLVYEGLIYALWTILLTLTLGNAAGYVLLQSLTKGMNFFTWHFTVTPIAAGIPVLLFLAALIPYVSYHVLCKKSIVERLRLSEL